MDEISTAAIVYAQCLAAAATFAASYGGEGAGPWSKVDVEVLADSWCRRALGIEQDTKAAYTPDVFPDECSECDQTIQPGMQSCKSHGCPIARIARMLDPVTIEPLRDNNPLPF